MNSNSNSLQSYKVLVQSPKESDVKYKFRCHLPRTLRNVRKIKWLSGCIPSTTYNFEAGVNNKVYIETGVSQYSVTLVDGDLAIDALVTELSTKLNALGIGSFTTSYDDTKFRITVSCAIPFRFISGVNDANYNLGFIPSNQVLSLTQTGENTVRLNSNKYIGVNIANAYGDSIDITGLNRTSTFCTHMDGDFGSLCFLGPQDLIGQEVSFDQNGVDLPYLDMEILRTDIHDYLRLDSDWSILLQIDYQM